MCSCNIHGLGGVLMCSCNIHGLGGVLMCVAVICMALVVY